MATKNRREMQKGVPKDRRIAQRRKEVPAAHGAPIRRDEDWEKIDSELKDD